MKVHDVFRYVKNVVLGLKPQGVGRVMVLPGFDPAFRTRSGQMGCEICA